MIIGISGKKNSGYVNNFRIFDIWKYYKQEKIEIMNNVKLKIKKIC